MKKPGIVPGFFTIQKGLNNRPKMAILRPSLSIYYPLKEEVFLEKEEE